MLITKPGMYQMSAAEYHADPIKDATSLSSSIAWEIEPSNAKAGSPAHGRMIHPKLGNQSKKSSDSMRFGTLCHTLLLGSGSEYSVAPIFKTRQGEITTSMASAEAKAWKEQCEEKGAMPVMREEFERAKICIQEWTRQIQEFKLDRILTCEKTEQVIAWLEGTSNVWCRAMLDIFIEGHAEIWDLKTMPSAHPKKILRHIQDFGLACRSEFYKRGISAIKPELAGRVKMGFIFASTDAPYLVTPVDQLNGQWRHIGRAQCERSIQTWGECLRTGKWPGYVEKTISQLECPSWCFKEEITEDETDE